MHGRQETFVCDIALAGGTPEQGQPAWPVKVTFTLAVEWCMLAAFSGEWLATGGHPAGASRLVLLPLGGAAIGRQSTAVRRLGQMPTTYLTSTLTGILTALATHRWPAEWQRSTGAILAAVVGATFGGLAAVRSPGWVPAALLIPISAVLAGSAGPARAGLPAVFRRPHAPWPVRKNEPVPERPMLHRLLTTSSLPRCSKPRLGDYLRAAHRRKSLPSARR